MPDDVDPVGIGRRDDGHVGVVVDDIIGVNQFPVHAAGERRPRQAGTDGLGQVGNRERLIEGLLRPVWQSDVRHVYSNQKKSAANPHFYSNHEHSGFSDDLEQP